MSSSKDNILNKIREALVKPVPLPFPQAETNLDVYLPQSDDLTVMFAQNFTGLLGKFAYCENHQELTQQLKEIIAAKNWKEVYCVENGLKYLFQKNGFSDFSTRSLAESDVAITSCELLVARTGTIVLSSALPEGRTASVYAPVHICVAESSQIVYDIGDALEHMKEKYGVKLPSMISFATGPSRTADIEKTLVVGVHGPKEVYCFLADL
jgi:L-lactate dehydrogenase complex protein LldG